MNVFNSGPQYRHGCDRCILLKSVNRYNSVEQQYKAVDLYYHPGDSGTLIARYSDEPSDYLCGITFAACDGMIAIAAVHALCAGHLSLNTLKDIIKL